MKGYLIFVSLFAFASTLSPDFLPLDLNKFKSKVNLFDGAEVTNRVTRIFSEDPDIHRARNYMYLVGASYCGLRDLTSWSCQYCKLATGQAFSSILFNSTVNTQALVTLNSADKEIVISFRGSYNVPNALQDVFLLQTNDKDTDIQVHRGFLIATRSLYPQVVDTLARLIQAHPDYNVVIAGHSLGGAMASLTLYMLLNRIDVPPTFPTPASYALFTYGQPRTGNKAYADYWNSQTIQVSRVVNKADIVPHAVSANLGYFHHSTELWINVEETGFLGLLRNGKSRNTICSKTVYEDPKCSNSLGPVYSVADHLFYWDVDTSVCLQEGTLPFLTQIIVPLV